MRGIPRVYPGGERCTSWVSRVVKGVHPGYPRGCEGVYILRYTRGVWKVSLLLYPGVKGVPCYTRVWERVCTLLIPQGVREVCTLLIPQCVGPARLVPQGVVPARLVPQGVVNPLPVDNLRVLLILSPLITSGCGNPPH